MPRAAPPPGGPSADGLPDNATLSELLAVESERAEGHVARAFRRAARAAFFWPEEASELWRRGRPLQELRAIGPFLQRRLAAWMEQPPPPPEPPPERRGFMTLAAARRTLARRPEWAQALRGDLQVHTTWSDGTAGVATMAEAGRARGYAYLAITDHSKTLRIANGMDEETLARQGTEIEAENERLGAAGHGFRLIPAIEMDLTPAGEGDTDREALARLPLVLGAFHSALRRTEDQTERYLAAVRNPDIHVLAHPRTRMFNRRRGLSADWPRVFAEAARRGVAVEVDAYPDRQDLEVPLLKEAVRAGAWISLGSDAHSPDELAVMEFGLAALALARAPKDRVLNFLPLDRLLRWAEERRSREGRPGRRRGPRRQAP